MEYLISLIIVGPLIRIVNHETITFFFIFKISKSNSRERKLTCPKKEVVGNHILIEEKKVVGCKIDP